MNKKRFDEELKKLLSTYSVDGRLLAKWFTSVLKQLETLAAQRQQITHPRHRGDAREADIRQVLASLFPPGLSSVKGFALNSAMSVSREQDILVCDAAHAARLLHAGECSYVPIEACLASVEIKSELTTEELRRAVVNCVTLKKLLFEKAFPPDYKRGTDYELCYAIFTYGCSLTLDVLAKRLNGLLADVPFFLRPNLVYVLGKGLLIPSEDKTLELSHEQMFCEGPFVPLPGLRTAFVPQSESYAFLWFSGSLVDHCLLERTKRPAPKLMEYVTRPVATQASFERHLQKTDPERYESILKNLGIARGA